MKTGTTIVMFIDNLQWGDAESWKLMKNLASDIDMDWLLFFGGAYRSNEK
jgi:predicted ATPase